MKQRWEDRLVLLKKSGLNTLNICFLFEYVNDLNNLKKRFFLLEIRDKEKVLYLLRMNCTRKVGCKTLGVQFIQLNIRQLHIL